MSDTTNPASHPERAAYQLIVELIRAQRVPVYSSNITGLIRLYDEAVEHFKKQENSEE